MITGAKKRVNNPPVDTVAATTQERSIAIYDPSRIEPIPCDERQWDEDVSSAIVEIGRREGETISLDEED